eukprot:TRINITY_DN19854_c0_g1_i1.p1 TRINITY_DN19854_c0_g1~~TRINITY_DN19854_c0_g1_i1.p1  ORF type:complete len:478 (+),score=53.34 TRINITY_DN19854_c0_g1_i1:236-1669(+)
MPKINNDPAILNTAPKHVCADRTLIIAAIERTARLAKFHPLSVAVPEIIDDDLLIIAVTHGGWRCLEQLEQHVRKGDVQVGGEVIEAAMMQPLGWNALQWASDEARSDPEIYLTALQLRPSNTRTPGPVDVFRWVPRWLLDDRSFVLAALELNGHVLSLLPTDLRSQAEFVLAAARSPHCPLEGTVFLDLLDEFKDFRSNREVVSAALQTEGRALGLASMELRADKEVCRTAVSTYGFALRWVMPPLQDDVDVVESAVRQDGHALQFASECRRADPHIARIALQQDPAALLWLPASLQNDSELVLVSVQSDGFTLRWAGPLPQSEFNLVIAAVSSNGLALQWASADMRSNREIVVAAVSNQGCALRYAGAMLQADRDVVLMAVSQDGWALRWAAESLRADSSVVMQAVRQDGRALQLIDASSAMYEEMSAVARASLAIDLDDEYDYSCYTPRYSELVGYFDDYLVSFGRNDSSVWNF